MTDSNGMVLKDFEKNIIEQLNKFTTENFGANKSLPSVQCTTEIKRIIGNIGQQLNYEVMAGGDNDFEGEWLYDIVWYSNNEVGFNKMILAVECEFSRGLKHIQYDFDKLLVTNAENRIMICMSLGNEPGFEKIITQCNEAINNYEMLPKGSRFLLLIWDDYHSGKFESRIIIKNDILTS